MNDDNVNDRLNAECKKLQAAHRQAQAENAALRALLKVAHCPHCGGVGYTVGADKYGEPVQEQCEWCFMQRRLIEDFRSSPAFWSKTSAPRAEGAGDAGGGKP